MRVLFLSLLFFPFIINAQLRLDSTIIDTTTIYSTLNEPWEIQYGFDSTLWVTEKEGLISRISPITKQKKLILDITPVVWVSGESGLLGFCFSNTFNIDKYVAIAYTYTQGSNNYLKIVRYNYNNTIDSLVNPFILIDSIPAFTSHDGCRIATLSDNSLLISTGDARDIQTTQDRSTLNGKFLRINFDKTIPFDNPNINSLVFSTGHRNPQGLFLYNNKVYSSEHGPATDDEINIIVADRNYGWPDVEGFCNTPSEIVYCSDSNIVEPIFTWTPTVAVSDLIVYDHPAIPEWRNSIILSTLKDQSLRQLRLNGTGDSIIGANTFFKNEFGRIRDLCFSPSGEIYFITNGFSRFGNVNQHKIVRLKNNNYTSITEIISPSLLKVFPNPCINELNFAINGFAKVDLKIYSIDGSLVLESLNHSKGSVDVRELENGIYFLGIHTEDGLITRKFVKQ